MVPMQTEHFRVFNESFYSKSLGYVTEAFKHRETLETGLVFDVLNHVNAGKEVKGHNSGNVFFYSETESGGDALRRVQQRCRVVCGTKITGDNIAIDDDTIVNEIEDPLCQ